MTIRERQREIERKKKKKRKSFEALVKEVGVAARLRVLEWKKRKREEWKKGKRPA